MGNYYDEESCIIDYIPLHNPIDGYPGWKTNYSKEGYNPKTLAKRRKKNKNKKTHRG